MWNLSVVLCVLLFGWAANSMDVDEEHSNDGLDKINNNRIPTEANKIREEITKEISTFMEKAKLIDTNLVQIATNVEDAGVNDWSIYFMNFIHTNGNQLVSNVEECIAKDVTSLRRLFNYCEYLRVHSGVKDKDKDVVDDSFYKEAGNTETDVKRGKIKEWIYFDAIMTFGTDKFASENMIDKIKQLLRYCQAEERGNFYTATIPYLISREHYIQKKIEGVHNLPAEYERSENKKKKIEEEIIRDLSFAKDKNFSLEDVLNKIRTYWQIDERIASYADVKKPIGEAHVLPRVPKEPTAGSSRTTSGVKPSERVPDANPNEIQIKTLSENEIMRIGAIFNFKPMHMVREIMIRMFSKEELSCMSASSSHKFTTIPSKVLDYVKEIVDRHAIRKLSDTVYMLTIDSLIDEIRNRGKDTVVRDSLEVKSQIESWLKADPSVVVTGCKGNAKCMVCRLMNEIFGQELGHMTSTSFGIYDRMPALALDLVEHYVNENAAVKLPHKDYLKYVRLRCRGNRRMVIEKEKKKNNKN